MIQQYDHSIPVKDLVLDKVSLWVQVHDTPIKFLSRDVAEKLCQSMREVKREVSQKEVERDKVMRIRVWVNVNLPLCCGRVFTRKNGVKGWVSFKYERLPNVCYCCGCLNYFDEDCEHWIQSNGTLKPKDQEYRPWLRAAPLLTHKNSMIIVPGYYEAKKKELEVEGRKQGSFGSIRKWIKLRKN